MRREQKGMGEPGGGEELGGIKVLFVLYAETHQLDEDTLGVEVGWP